MRRAHTLSIVLAAALAATGGGCASAPHAARPAEHRPVSLARGDGVGRMMFRDAPDFAVAASTTDSNLATVEPETPSR